MLNPSLQWHCWVRQEPPKTIKAKNVTEPPLGTAAKPIRGRHLPRFATLTQLSPSSAVTSQSLSPPQTTTSIYPTLTDVFHSPLFISVYFNFDFLQKNKFNINQSIHQSIFFLRNSADMSINLIMPIFKD